MKNYFFKLFMLFLLVSVTSITFNGCAYMHNRYNDFKDIADFGISVNTELKPQIGFYFDFFNILPIGYSNVNGKALGWGNRNGGWVDHIDENWGIIGWGKEKRCIGKFNPLDPHQTRLDQREIKEPHNYNVGPVKMIADGDVPPLPQYFECNRVIHLGWIGVYLYLRPADILDFIVGWTTLDIMRDDLVKPKKSEENKESKK